MGGSGSAVGDNGDFANAIALDAAGNAYVTGDAFSTDFPVTPGAFQSTNPAAASESPDAFVTKLNATGTALVYSTCLGGGGAYAGNQGGAIAVDAAGNAYVAGRTTSAEFPVTQGAFQTTYPSSNDGGTAFVSKLNPAGTGLVYSTYLGGSGGVVNVTPTLAFLGGDQASGLAIDSSGNVYLTGSTASANFPVTPGAFQSTNHDQAPCGGGCIGGFNAFITELNSTGSALAYSTYLGGDGINPGDTVGVLVYGSGDTARALALDNSGNLYVAGFGRILRFSGDWRGIPDYGQLRVRKCICHKTEHGCDLNRRHSHGDGDHVSIEHHLSPTADGDGYRQRWKRQSGSDRRRDARQRRLPLRGSHAQ